MARIALPCRIILVVHCFLGIDFISLSESIDTSTLTEKTISGFDGNSMNAYLLSARSGFAPVEWASSSIFEDWNLTREQQARRELRTEAEEKERERLRC